MLKNLFRKKPIQEAQEVLYAPLSGKVIPIEEVPDPVFANKMMGEGLAIIPTEGNIAAPIDGEVVQIFHTKHAIGLQSKKGLEILIHIGLETVNLKGEGFTIHVKEGDKVSKGDLLVTFDIDFLKQSGKDIVTPMIITNSEDKLSSLEVNLIDNPIEQNASLAIAKLKD
ncbi:MAG: PTS glucose transporter subunit IIA [Bacillus sp. (in: firmicutes)]